MTDILVIEDDPDIALSLRHNLEQRGGYSVAVAENGDAGLTQATADPPALVLLDLNLPDLDGVEVCRRLRQQEVTAAVPIIMLTARVEEADRVKGLEIGADDYVTKPFSIRELLARVGAVLRRARRDEAGSELLVIEPLRVDLGARQVLVEQREVVLTRKEFDLLVDLMRNRGRVLSRERLLERVWGYEAPGQTRTVDVHVRQLRKKLGEPVGEWVETVVGVGYRFRSAR